MVPPWSTISTSSGIFGSHFVGSGAEGRAVSSSWLEPGPRGRMLARARWVLLSVLGLYGMLAAWISRLGGLGVYRSPGQAACLLASAGGVALGNVWLQARPSRWSGQSRWDRIPLVADLLFVSVVIWCSGGTGSWFQPAYLLVTMEAALLLDRRWDVWIVGAAGGAFYGVVLLAQYFHWFWNASAPFNGQENLWYLGLQWSWVATLNTVTAIITAYLMSLIRQEHGSLQQREAQLQGFLDAAYDLIACFTREGEIFYTNPQWNRILGSNLEIWSGRNVFDLIALEHRTRFLKQFKQAQADQQGVEVEGEFVAQGGRLVSIEGHIVPALGAGGSADLYWVMCRDVTERRQAEAEIKYLADYDPLTGLPNRRSWLARVSRDSCAENQGKGRMAVLFIDLDRFKMVNDTLGHAIGDQLLQAVAHRITSALRDTDHVCRQGGDEFIATLSSLKDAHEAATLAKRILCALAKPFQIGAHELFITASIGISLFPEDAIEMEDLVRKSDIAMYHAKNRGRNDHAFYDLDMEAQQERNLKLAGSLCRALENGELELVYQPKVDLASNAVTGLEVLVRWEHGELGPIPPSEFIPIAEESGHIGSLGRWVLESACRQAVAWQKEGLPQVRIGVNLSGYQLQDECLFDMVRGVIRESGLSPEWLELEITETVVMQHPVLAVEAIEKLRNIGVHVAIDDFGTGYSSLAQLKRFPVNTLKIDKSFIRDLETNGTDAAIVTAIISMATCMNLSICAEGVETEGQLKFLKDRACHGAQGFLFSVPLSSHQAGLLLRGRSGCSFQIGQGSPFGEAVS